MLSFSPRDVLDAILDLLESVSEGFPTYSYIKTGNVDVRFKHMIINHPVLCNILSQDLSKVSYLFGPRILQKCYLYIRQTFSPKAISKRRSVL